MRALRPRAAFALLLGCLALITYCAEPRSESTGDWPVYAGDKASTKYSPLDQVTSENFGDLEIAWRWKTIDQPILDANRSLWTGRNESTPIAIDGILYTSTSLNQVAAIDGATGETLWSYDPGTWGGEHSPPNLGFIHRGVAFWEADGHPRIIYATGDAYLIALDAETGEPIVDFGDGGRIDLTEGLRRPIGRMWYGVSSPPVICRDRIIVGSTIPDAVVDELMPPGDVRGFDGRTGEQLWTFESIPQTETAGADSWGDAWRSAGNTNVWSYMSCDEELGIVYLPFSTPSNDYYGGYRTGDNLYAETLVAVKAETGERVWHFQAVHHGIWDYDLPAAPELIDITVDGRAIRAIAQVSKQAMTYVLDRETGEPVWPIEERPVPQEPVVPGERLWPTQPFPTRPAPFDRHGISPDELIDFTPELKAEAEAILARYDYGPIFTPLSERGTIAMPGIIGGASWAGASVDPETGMLYVPSVTLPFTLWAVRDTTGTGIVEWTGTWQPGPDGPQGLPLVKPPWGRVTAIDLNTGEHVWMRTMGDGPRDHPALAGLDLPELGWPHRTFLLTTPTVLLAAQEGPWSIRGFTENALQLATGDLDPSLQALDKGTGERIGRIPLPGNASGAMITYMAGGRQYIAVPIGGASQPAELVALRLPLEGTGTEAPTD